jgi:Ca2+-transporting ATPase
VQTSTVPRGLTGAEADARRAADGPNAVPPPPRRGLAARIGHQLSDPLVALLIVAAVVTAALGDVPDTVVIVLVVTVNTLIGVVQEVRADRAIAALDRLAAPTARVRDDVVRLEAGDIVPADLRLVEAYRLSLDESALTGESVPVHRAAGDEAYAGTVLTTGRATAVVVRIGPASALGRIADLVTRTRPGPTPLQRRIAALGRVLGITAVAVSAVVFVAGVLSGQPLTRMAITAVSLVVAAVPESLPAVLTLALALGAHRMARTSAIPRRLHAVETLGSVTVIASDKTGTLTEGRMSVQRAVTADGAGWEITGTGYAPEGEVRPDPRPGSPGTGLTGLARAALLCNDAGLIPPAPDRPDWTAAGDPMEAALVTLAARCGLDPEAVRADAPRVAEEPFDQQHRRMTTVHRDAGGYLTVRKGAPENVLDPAADAAPGIPQPQ